MKPNRRLVLPRQLAVTTLVMASACAAPAPAPDVVDAADIQTIMDTWDAPDVADAPDIADVPDVPDVPCTSGTFRCLPNWAEHPGAVCPNDNVCTADQCGPTCGGCTVVFPNSVAGIPCLPDGRSDAGDVPCPGTVCEASHCPVGCRTCSFAMTCVPNGPSEAGVDVCMYKRVCDPADCPPGCFAV